MEKALVTVATGVLNPVIGKLSSLLEKEYTLFTGVRREVTSLRTLLERMKAVLKDLSVRENPSAEDEQLMKELRELSYDIEDSVDEFLLRIDAEPTKLKGFKGFMKRISNFFSKIKTRCRIAHEVKHLKVQVMDVGDWHQKFSVVGNTQPSDHHQTADSIVRSLSARRPESELVGIDGPKKELISKLTEGVGEQEKQLKIVPIVGAGGMGKTTLANLVYTTYGRESFTLRAFVSISQNPNWVEILRSIHSQVTKPFRDLGFPKPGFSFPTPEELGRVTNVQQLKDHILDFLENESYFIVIDDLWDELHWKIIHGAFPKNECGSKIVTTTRDNKVAESCSFPHRGYIYELQKLSYTDSESLFLRNIKEEHCPSHLEHHFSTILRKCAGVPLAIYTVSGLLAKPRAEAIWNRVQNSIISSVIERDGQVTDEQMSSILSLSYFYLPPHLKSCFIYLSIFPESYIIEKKSLVKRWIGEGFILEEESGESHFNELIDRHLIQPAERNIFGEVKSCQVHAIILEFSVRKSLEENFVTMLGVPNKSVPTGQQKKVRRLSLQDSSQEDDTPLSTGWIFSHARSVTVFGNLRKLPSLLVFRIIRVLDLENCDLSDLHSLDNLGNLFRLKYLSLKNTSLSELPEKTVELENLETLNLKRNKISQLPPSIVRLQRLVCLLIDVKVKLPDGIGKMQALQELKLISLMEQPSNFVQELSHLTNLRELSLSLESSDAVDAGNFKECTETMVSSICNLRRLHSLSICIGRGCDDGFLHGSWSTPPSSLRRLIIKKAPISRVPEWMGPPPLQQSPLVNLQQLYLHLKALNHEDVSVLGRIPALDRLVLYVEEGEDVVVGFPNEWLDISSSHGFSSLRYLKIDGTDPRSLGLNFQVGSMPRLEEIELMLRAVETPDLTSDNFGFGMEHLGNLVIVICEIDFRPLPKSNRGVGVQEQGPQVVSEEGTQVVNSPPPLAVRENAAMEPTSQVVGDEEATRENAAMEPTSQVVAARVLEKAIRRALSGHPNKPKLIIREIHTRIDTGAFLMYMLSQDQIRQNPQLLFITGALFILWDVMRQRGLRWGH